MLAGLCLPLSACGSSSDAAAASATTAATPAGGATPVDVAGLSTNPYGVAVDRTGSLYIADEDNHQVLKLTQGAALPTQLPFTEIGMPVGIAVNNAGDVYVTDPGGDRVWELPAAEQTTPMVLNAFTGLGDPGGIAVDNRNGTIYVIEGGAKTKSDSLWELTSDADKPTRMELGNIGGPVSIATDNLGNLYLATATYDANYRTHSQVWKIPADSTTPVRLPFANLHVAGGLAVDNTGALFVTDWGDTIGPNRVLKYRPGDAAPTVLPFPDAQHPAGIAVDNTGTVYVTNLTGSHAVWKLEPGQ